MNKTEHLLIILAEECAEVIKETSKALRFGLSDHAPDSKITNAESIVKEVADLTAIIEMLQAENLILNPPLYYITEKKQKVEKWLKYSKEKGTLNN